MYVAVFFSHSLPSLDLSVSFRLLASASSLSLLGYVIVNWSMASLCFVRRAIRLLISLRSFSHPAIAVESFGIVSVCDLGSDTFYTGVGKSPASTCDSCSDQDHHM